MMSYSQIVAMNDTVTRRAKRARTVPLVLNAGDSVRGIPALGYSVPRGWTLVAKHFVDSSGFGSDNEPAMSERRFTEYVEARPGFGWAIIEAGQFQVYVGQYARKVKTPTLGSCGCKRGMERDNCPACEGTGRAIDFKAIREANAKA